MREKIGLHSGADGKKILVEDEEEEWELYPDQLLCRRARTSDTSGVLKKREGGRSGIPERKKKGPLKKMEELAWGIELGEGGKTWTGARQENPRVGLDL